MNPYELAARLKRLERRLPSAGNGDSDVIRVVLDLKNELDGPAATRAALEALPPGDMRDHFLDRMDSGGNFLPSPDAAEWEPPGELVYSTTPEGFRLISVAGAA